MTILRRKKKNQMFSEKGKKSLDYTKTSKEKNGVTKITGVNQCESLWDTWCGFSSAHCG